MLPHLEPLKIKEILIILIVLIILIKKVHVALVRNISSATESKQYQWFAKSTTVKNGKNQELDTF